MLPVSREYLDPSCNGHRARCQRQRRSNNDNSDDEDGHFAAGALSERHRRKGTYRSTCTHGVTKRPTRCQQHQQVSLRVLLLFPRSRWVLVKTDRCFRLNKDLSDNGRKGDKGDEDLRSRCRTFSSHTGSRCQTS